MKSLLLAIVTLATIAAHADSISLRCGTNSEKYKTVVLGNGSDYSRGGMTGKDSDWGLGIRGKDVNGAKVKIISEDDSVTAIRVILPNSDVLYFRLGVSDSRAALTIYSAGSRDPIAQGGCSFDVD